VRYKEDYVPVFKEILYC